MATKKAKTEEAVPTFTLRADQTGHLRALIAAADSLPAEQNAAAAAAVREFELWADAGRG